MPPGRPRTPAPARLLVPLLDILQSVPILSFLSVTMVWFLSLSPGRVFGAELACVFTIFTGQAWNMAFSFYQSLRTVPRELEEAGRMFGLNAWARFWRIEAPFATPPLIWNMMMSMSGGWFFVTAVRSHQRGQDQHRPARHRLLDRGRHRAEEPARHLRGHRRHAGGDPDL